MHLTLKVISLLLITISCLTVTRAQSRQNSRQLNQQDAHIRKVVDTLDENNELRIYLEQGERGDGVHYAWMNDMHKLKIKQVSYTFNFEWDRGVLKVNINKTTYHQKYYQFDTRIKSAATLNRIVDSGLKDELEVEARTRATLRIQKLIEQEQPHYKACGTVYITLLDDETLPIIDGMPYIDTDLDCMQNQVSKN